MNISPSFLALWSFLILYFIYLLCVCKRNLQKLRASGRKLHYSIVDIWALIIGLTPSLLLLGNLRALEGAGVSAYLFIIVFVCAQLAGMFVAQVDYVVATAGSAEASALTSAANIVLGALLYAVALLAGFVVGFILLPASIIYLVCYGFGEIEKPRKRKMPGVSARHSTVIR